MIAQAILSRRQIVITAADYDRLWALVDSPRYRTTHAVLLTALREELERAMIVPPNRVPQDVVTMNARVQVRDLRAGESATYTLVYPEEADIEQGRLSVLAPLGTALLGTRVGQIIKFDAPAGVRRLKIERIEFQPEAAGSFHL